MYKMVKIDHSSSSSWTSLSCSSILFWSSSICLRMWSKAELSRESPSESEDSALLTTFLWFSFLFYAYVLLPFDADLSLSCLFFEGRAVFLYAVFSNSYFYLCLFSWSYLSFSCSSLSFSSSIFCFIFKSILAFSILCSLTLFSNLNKR